jgi:hypothetical protein
MSSDTFWKREYFVVVSQKMFDSSCLRTGNISDDSIKTKLYDKRDEINLPIMNSPFLYHNIPTAPAYGVNRILL